MSDEALSGGVEASAVPEGLSRTFTTEEWSALPEGARQKMASTVHGLTQARTEQVQRLHETIGRHDAEIQRLKANGIGANGNGQSSQPSGGTSVERMSDDQWSTAKNRVLRAWEAKQSAGPDDELPPEVASLTIDSVNAVFAEDARRQAQRVIDADRAERSKQDKARQVNGLLAARLTSEVSGDVLNDSSNPIHQRAVALKSELLALGKEGDVDSILEFAAFRVAKAEADREAARRRQSEPEFELGSPEHLAAINRANADERQRISALKTQGKPMEARSARLSAWLDGAQVEGSGYAR